MPPVNRPAIRPLEAPASNIPSWSSTRVEHGAALATDLLGEGDPEQPLLRGRDVQLARDLAGVLPVLQVRRHLAAHELGAHITDVAHASPSCTWTSRERTHSPSPLACGSNRVDAATPSPSRPADQHVDRAEVRQHVDLDVEAGRLRHQRRGSCAALISSPQPGDAGVVLRRAVVLPPTGRGSRRRPCRRSGRARTCPAASGGSPSRSGAGYGEGRRPCVVVGDSANSVGSATTSRRPSACTTVCVTAERSTYSAR